MNLRDLFVNSLGGGFFVVILWVGFWTIIIPHVLSLQAWPGHEDLTLPVFAVGFMGGLVISVWQHR